MIVLNMELLIEFFTVVCCTQTLDRSDRGGVLVVPLLGVG